MLKYKLLLLFLILSAAAVVSGTESTYKFRLYLKDKGTSAYTINNPSAYLSEKAIERRVRQHIPIDETDLPISQQYISQIESLGCEIAAKSKWLGTITVHVEDSALVEQIKGLDFVENVTCVWEGNKNLRSSKFSALLKKKEAPPEFYGTAYPQIAMHNGDSLHRAGYRGAGIEIAVIDAGFKGFDDNVLLENINLKGKKNFIHHADNDYEGDHGLRVLSCMATNLPHIFVGTAPDAGYWLLQSENPASEFPVEEDYWVAAAEFADSVGVDVVNISLGYTTFDDSTMDYTQEEMDGKTTFITQGTNMASQKGMLIVGSAGNEGNKPWKLISAPGDSDEILTVGAIRPDSILAAFSSRGPTADGRIKPDVLAVGNSAATLTWDGYTGYASGTSYSSPIMCGLVACLWQAFPNFTNKEIIQIVRESANRYTTPDNDFGYGIPDMIKAMQIATDKTTGIKENVTELKKKFKITTERTGHISITRLTDNNESFNIRILTIDGRVILSDNFKDKEKTYQLNPVKGTIYLLSIHSTDFIETEKLFF